MVSDRHRRRRHNHPQPHSPPIHPFFSSPQPLYLYSGPASPPVIFISQLGSSKLSPRSKNCIMCLAVPIYMIPVLALVCQPMPGLAYAAPQPSKSQPALSRPVRSSQYNHNLLRTLPGWLDVIVLVHMSCRPCCFCGFCLRIVLEFSCRHGVVTPRA